MLNIAEMIEINIATLLNYFYVTIKVITDLVRIATIYLSVWVRTLESRLFLYAGSISFHSLEAAKGDFWKSS